jgi:hypothetical protein
MASIAYKISCKEAIYIVSSLMRITVRHPRDIPIVFAEEIALSIKCGSVVYSTKKHCYAFQHSDIINAGEM